jgi:hypothetical protein
MATYKKWTQTELDFIVNNQLVLNDDGLSVKLSEITGENISRSMVRRQRRKLNIKKNRGRPRKDGGVANVTTPEISEPVDNNS